MLSVDCVHSFIEYGNSVITFLNLDLIGSYEVIFMFILVPVLLHTSRSVP